MKKLKINAALTGTNSDGSLILAYDSNAATDRKRKEPSEPGGLSLNGPDGGEYFFGNRHTSGRRCIRRVGL